MPPVGEPHEMCGALGWKHDSLTNGCLNSHAVSQLCDANDETADYFRMVLLHAAQSEAPMADKLKVHY